MKSIRTFIKISLDALIYRYYFRTCLLPPASKIFRPLDKEREIMHDKYHNELNKTTQPYNFHGEIHY